MFLFTNVKAAVTTLSALILINGTANIVLTAIADHSLREEGGLAAGCWPQLTTRGHCNSLALIPAHLRNRPAHATIAAGAIALLCGFLGLTWIVKLLDSKRKDEDEQSFKVSVPLRNHILC